MKNLFVYGSLMYAPVWQRLITQRYLNRNACLHGYQRYLVKHETYPGIIPTGKGKVEGRLVMNLRSRDIRKLDRFEGDYYRRMPLTVSTTKGARFRAEAYVIKPRYYKLLSNQHWDACEFETNQIQIFLSRYKNFNR